MLRNSWGYLSRWLHFVFLFCKDFARKVLEKDSHIFHNPNLLYITIYTIISVIIVIRLPNIKSYLFNSTHSLIFSTHIGHYTTLYIILTQRCFQNVIALQINPYLKISVKLEYSGSITGPAIAPIIDLFPGLSFLLQTHQ